MTFEIVLIVLLALVVGFVSGRADFDWLDAEIADAGGLPPADPRA